MNAQLINLDEQGPLTVMVFGRGNKNERYLAEHGSDFWQVLWDFTEHFLRRKVSKGEHNYKTAQEALQAVNDKIYALLDERGVSLEAVD